MPHAPVHRALHERGELSFVDVAQVGGVVLAIHVLELRAAEADVIVPHELVAVHCGILFGLPDAVVKVFRRATCHILERSSLAYFAILLNIHATYSPVDMHIMFTNAEECAILMLS